MQIKCKNDLLTLCVLAFQNAAGYGCLVRLFVLKTSKQLLNADSNEARKKKTKNVKKNKKR